MTVFRPEAIHVRDEFRYGSIYERENRKRELQDLGIKCVSFNRGSEYFFKVAQTATERDDELLREYYDEQPSWMDEGDG